MYTKDKSTRITLRLNDAQFAFVKLSADDLGVSPSDFLRMVINSTMSISNRINGIQVNVKQEGVGRENDKADSDHLV